MTARKTRQNAWFLLIVCVLMMMSAVFPHHHHCGQLLCMQDDRELCASACADGSHTHAPENGCSEGCVTKFNVNTPQRDSIVLQSPMIVLSDLFVLSHCLVLNSFMTESETVPPVYVEHLHGIDIPRSGGLRAPPQV